MISKTQSGKRWGTRFSEHACSFDDGSDETGLRSFGDHLPCDPKQDLQQTSGLTLLSEYMEASSPQDAYAVAPFIPSTNIRSLLAFVPTVP